MSNFATMDRMYYIVDGSGNYYRINGNDNLVAAGGRENAGVFSFVEANQRIGGGKKAHFYSAIPIEECKGMCNEAIVMPMDSTRVCHAELDGEGIYSDEEEENEQVTYNEKGKMSLPYDLKKMDWNEYLNHFCYIASGIHNYQDELNQALSDIDMQISDIMHYVELYEPDADESIRMIELLKECREQRRDVKDEMFCVECFQKAIGNSSNIVKVKDGIKQISKLAARTYHPRKLQELFENRPQKTNRHNKLLRVLDGKTCMDVEKECCENEYYEREYCEREYCEEKCCKADNAVYDAKEAGVIMEYTRKDTVFDGRENDWKQFAKQQADFYANAEQYMYNLQADMREIDIEIEEIMREIEDANYNVTQGYKVVKHLKELRNVRKKKQKELECVYILTEQFNCGAVAEAMEECVREIEAVVMEGKQEEKLEEKREEKREEKIEEAGDAQESGVYNFSVI